ncbi:MAG: hypothetical protein HPY61_07935 [Methanotrichaceae archaeon]|nr:hypothetical protein [Methanotrichaceae archaeon]
MKFSMAIIMLLFLLVTPAISIEEPGVHQLGQMMMSAADNLTTYAYSRQAEASIAYQNQTLDEQFLAVKETSGMVNLPDQAGWWNAALTDKETGEILTWQGYLVNGSEYWKEDQNWTRFLVNNTTIILEEYNELPGQVALIQLSDMQIVGSEQCDGEECYRLEGTPIEPIMEGILALQLLASYFGSPFPLPDELENASFSIGDTNLLNNSRVAITAWVSKNSSLLKRLDIDSSLTISPEILNISEPEFNIKSLLNESTIYSAFGQPVTIELPREALNESYRLKGTDWRWAAFGSVRP